MEQLQTGSPERLTMLGIIAHESAMIHERRLHEQFAHLRSHGEWFVCDPELTDYIAANMDPLPEGSDLYPDPEPVEEVVRLSMRPRIPKGIAAPKGDSRAARMARYKLARGIA